jgi:hypothetical protein
LTAPPQAGGRANAPSAPFTVALSGNQRSVAAPVVVTPSDGNAGGTFFPPSVRLTTDAPSAIFRYRPKSAFQGTVSITPSNSSGLQNPAPVAYVVSGVAPTATGYVISGPSSGSIGKATEFLVSLVPAGAVPPSSMDSVGGIMVVGVTDGTSNGVFTPISPYPMKGSVLLSSDRPSATFTYTPTAAGVVTLSSGTRFDVMPKSPGVIDPAPLTFVVAP